MLFRGKYRSVLYEPDKGQLLNNKGRKEPDTSFFFRTCQILLVLFLLCASRTYAGTPEWNARDPFAHGVFIENLGQYAPSTLTPAQPVLFGARRDGLDYYFTANSIVILYLGTKAEPELGKEDDDDEKDEPAILQRHEIRFSGTSSSVRIIGEEEISTSYHFCLDNKKTLTAKGFRKIMYKNLFSGIDMEVFFPQDKQGFKYNFILHPGADPSQIRWFYPQEKTVNTDVSGNLMQESEFGLFTDHAPVAFMTSNGKTVSCAYVLKKNAVSFQLGNYPHSESLTVDPWTTTPVLSGNRAYDVDHDNAGNCYVYGGRAPYELIKYNSLGNPVWSFTTSNFTGYPAHPFYGDFAVDRTSGSVYIVEGANVNGAEMIKLTAGGLQVAFYAGNPSLTEMWRIAFSGCTHQLVMGGGGISHPSFTSAYIDTTFNTFTPVGVIPSPNGYHDIWGICVDNASNCYMTSSKANAVPGGYDDQLIKAPVPSLSPNAWQVYTRYTFVEGFSTKYIPRTNGYNGIASSQSYVYTYDSHILRKWNTLNGAMIDSAIVNGPSIQNARTYGGITTDECGHVFVGLCNTVRQYDANLNLVNTLNAQDTVYDLSLGQNGLLYACGHNFVQALSSGVPPCTPTLTVVNRTTCDSAIIQVSGGAAPYQITWNTNPVQHGPAASGLTPGIYIATISDQGCNPQTLLDTIVIHPLMAPFHLRDTSACPPLCLSFHPDTVQTGVTFLWDFGDGSNANQANPSHCYTQAGTYSVTLKETVSGCTAVSVSPSNITVYAKPQAGFEYVVEPASDAMHQVCFTNTSTAGTLQSVWWFGDAGNSSSRQQDTCFGYIGNASGSDYCVKLMVQNQWGCTDSIVHCLSLEPDFSLYVPNAFTPNGDGLNDVFLPVGEGIDLSTYTLWIFDRWGNLIWQTSDFGKGWDGRANNGKDISQEDTYVWKINCRDLKKNPHNLVGEVSLVK
jgi:gliding motility-associated-like protein